MDWLGLDQAATLWINHHHCLALDAVLLPVSYFGERGAGWLLIAVLMLIFGGRRERLTTLAFLVVLGATEFLLMPLIREALPRPRPYMYLPDVRQLGVRWAGTSFPSAHAYLWVYAALFYGAIFRRWRWPLWVGTALTLYARPYCGMHHVSDVLAGALLGLALGLPALALVRKWGWLEKERQAEPLRPDKH
jgi:membrane-associated phospholipid phosphatase